MKPVFGDTSFFLGLINPNDQHHRRAQELQETLESSLVITSWVVMELANGLSATRYRNEFSRLLAALQSDANVEIIPPNAPLFDRGCRLYAARPDKEWSLTDCISFLAMEDRGVTDALTTDKHFEQAGFRALLRS